MSTFNSANSQTSSFSNLYNYAQTSKNLTSSGSGNQYETRNISNSDAGDIDNQPVSMVGSSDGVDFTLVGQLLQLLSILLEMFKNQQTSIGGNEMPTVGANSKSAAPVMQQTSMSSQTPDLGGKAATASNAASGGGLSDSAIAANPEVGKWNKEIAAASKATGLDPNQIGAQIWAESRGNLNTHTQNVDGTIDHGLIQIGQERWMRDIVPNLSTDDRAKIKEATGKNAEDLDVTQPMDNVVAGAFHTKGCIAKEGGDLERGLRYYNSGDAANAGSSGYVKNVEEYMRELKAGEKLQQDPYNGTFGSGQGGQV